MIAVADNNNVTRSPAWEARFDEVERLAKLDARAGMDPRELTGELAGYQDEYDDLYGAELVAIAKERTSN